MNHGIHFISGLPRSGSTLLAAILRQNPSLSAGMSSPVASMVIAMQRQMSQENEAASFISDVQREAILRGIVAGYYAEQHPGRVVIDTNRAWCAKLPLIAKLYPEARIIACVRNVSWIMDSFERLVRANALEPSQIYNFDAGGTVFSRTSGLAASAGSVGYALDALREGFFSQEATGRLMLLTYETLTGTPREAIAAVYGFLGIQPFAHDFERIEYDAEEFDRRLGAPGLHRVARRVEYRQRQTVLPPSLFAQFSADAFWLDGLNPRGVAVL